MSTDYRLVIGKRIAELREAKGLTQQTLADLAGIKRPNLARIETGKYSTGIDIIAQIAEALGCEIKIE